MSPVLWRIVQLDDSECWCHPDGHGIVHSITAEAPPEVVPAVWTHEGCERCGGSGEVEITHEGASWEAGRKIVQDVPCPAPPRLVPWKGEET